LASDDDVVQREDFSELQASVAVPVQSSEKAAAHTVVELLEEVGELINADLAVLIVEKLAHISQHILLDN
jgi:hypothetical protein